MIRLTVIRMFLALICGVFVFDVQTAAAQRSRRGMSSRITQQLQREIKEIQKDLPKAEEEFSKADKALIQAQSQFRQAQTELEQARRSLADRLGPKVGLPDAMQRADQARKTYDEACAEFVRDHRDDEKFVQRRQAYSAAEDRLNAFRVEKVAKSDARKEKLTTLTRAAQEAKDAYQSPIDADPSVKPKREQLVQAETKLQEVRKKLSQESKNDTEVKSADAGFKQAKSALEQADATASAAAVKVSWMQEKIATNLALLGY